MITVSILWWCWLPILQKVGVANHNDAHQIGWTCAVMLSWTPAVLWWTHRLKILTLITCFNCTTMMWVGGDILNTVVWVPEPQHHQCGSCESVRIESLNCRTDMWELYKRERERERERVVLWGWGGSAFVQTIICIPNQQYINFGCLHYSN